MIRTGLPVSVIYIIKSVLAAGALFLFICLVYVYKKQKRIKLWITFPLFLIFCSATIAVFSLELQSKEDAVKFEKMKKETFETGEQLIVSLELYVKQYRKYPRELNTLLAVNPGLKFTDAWGAKYSYHSDSLSFRLSFQIPGDEGYYFYNSVTGAHREQGYLFKYMDKNIIR